MDEVGREGVRTNLERKLGERLQRFKNELMNNHLRECIRSEVIFTLREFQLDGLIPEETHFAGCQVESDDRGSIQIQTPVHLAIWFKEGDAMRYPNWTHDCDGCTFLATLYHEGTSAPPGRYDLYHCGDQLHGMPTIIARRSSEPGDYMSGLPIARAYLEDEPGHPMALALRLAEERGLKL